MTEAMMDVLHRRVRRFKAARLKQRWAARQQDHAAGSWYRFRFVLARSERAWQVDDATVDQLLEEGYHVEPAGLELHPPKRMVVVSKERAEQLSGAKPLAMHLDRAMLEARAMVLIPFR